jgi:O-antigen ligase
MTSKLIIGILGLIMVYVVFSPLNLCIFYLVIRPLAQPWAMKGKQLILGIPLTAVFPVILIAGAIIHCALRKEYRILIGTIIPIYIYMFIASISIYHTMSIVASIAEIFKIGAGIAMYLLVYNSVRTVQDAQKLLFGVTIMSIVPLVFGFHQYVAWGMGSTRVTSIFVEANAYGEFLGIMFCAALMLLSLLQGRKRYLVMFIIGALVVSMILSRNRGQWIALGVALSFSYIVYRSKIKLRKYIVPAIIIGVIFSGTFVQRFEELHQTYYWGQSKNTFEGRIMTWVRCLKLVPKHPLVGYGAGTADLVNEHYFGKKVMPHNDYVKALMENGFLGLYFYIMFLVVVLVDCIRIIRSTHYWHINYSMLILVIFWIVLSSAQNMLSNVVVFPFFMGLIALAKKFHSFRDLNTPGGEVPAADIRQQDPTSAVNAWG